MVETVQFLELIEEVPPGEYTVLSQSDETVRLSHPETNEEFTVERSEWEIAVSHNLVQFGS